MKHRILFVAGGTGGHMFPAGALADTCTDFEVYLLTDPRGAKYVSSGIYAKTIIITKYFKFLYEKRTNIFFKIPYMVLLFISSAVAIHQTKPSFIWGFGGEITFFPIIISRIFGIPCGIHQSDSILGRSNRILSRFLGFIATGFPETKYVPKHVTSIFTGTPVNADLFKVPDVTCDGELRICVLGGSQGAAVFADLVPDAIAILYGKIKISVIHQCVNGQKDALEKRYENLQIPATVTEFIYDMPDALSKSNLVISRSGASTISELMAAGRSAFFVPYPFATDDHQFYNANFIASCNAGWIGRNPDANALAEFLLNCSNDPMKLINAGKIMRSLCIRDSAKKMHNLMLEKMCKVCK